MSAARRLRRRNRRREQLVCPHKWAIAASAEDGADLGWVICERCMAERRDVSAADLAALVRTGALPPRRREEAGPVASGS